MEHNQVETQNSGSMKDWAHIGTHGGQQGATDAIDEDGGSTGGDLDILFGQDLSENTLVEFNGGQLSNNYVDEAKESYGDGGGRTGGDWIVNHNQILVATGE